MRSASKTTTWPSHPRAAPVALELILPALLRTSTTAVADGGDRRVFCSACNLREGVSRYLYTHRRSAKPGQSRHEGILIRATRPHRATVAWPERVLVFVCSGDCVCVSVSYSAIATSCAIILTKSLSLAGATCGADSCRITAGQIQKNQQNQRKMIFPKAQTFV